MELSQRSQIMYGMGILAVGTARWAYRKDKLRVFQCAVIAAWPCFGIPTVDTLSAWKLKQDKEAAVQNDNLQEREAQNAVLMGYMKRVAGLDMAPKGSSNVVEESGPTADLAQRLRRLQQQQQAEQGQQEQRAL